MTARLNYQSYGEGKPLFILHGLFGSHRNWAGIARQLSDQYQVITIDLRNHGDSFHSDSMSYIDMAADITSLAADLGHKSINILGHSMGGKTAMSLSLLNPSLVNNLIVVDIAPVRYPTVHDELISAMLSLSLQDISSRQHADELLGQHITDETLRQFLLQNLVRNDSGYIWRLNLGAIKHNHHLLRGFPDEVSGKTFNNPALFLSGELSDYVMPAHNNIIAEYFPASTHVVIKNARHWVHADKPAEVLNEIRNFLG